MSMDSELQALAARLRTQFNTVTTALGGKQPLDSDLTAIAVLSTTSYGRAFLELANQAALMGLIQAASDTVQGKVELATDAEAIALTDTARAVTPAALNACLGNLSYMSATAIAAAYQPLDGDLTTLAGLTQTSYGQAFLTLANQAALMALLSSASDTVQGKVELATTGETTTGTDTTRAVTPAGVKAVADTLKNNTQAINTQTGTTYTLVLADAEKLVTLSNASGITLTVPTNASVAFPVGTKVEVAAIGAGTVTIAGSGVTFINAVGLKLTTGNGAMLQKIATNTWLVIGGLSA